MEQVIHKADTRGYANHGWLESYHSFSFAGYYNPERMQFGTLRVLNDDRVAAGMGFGTHPHSDMEIFTYVIEGQLEHRDSMGNGSVIERHDVDPAEERRVGHWIGRVAEHVHGVEPHVPIS